VRNESAVKLDTEESKHSLKISIPKSSVRSSIVAMDKTGSPLRRRSQLSSTAGGAAEFIEAIKDGSVTTPKNMDLTPGPLSPTKFKARAD
jgi:hypothetical protein